MATKDPFEIVLDQLKYLHDTHAETHAFCPFPDDVKRQEITPYHVLPSDLFQNEKGLTDTNYPELRDAMVALSPQMIWRETYKDTDIGADFMDRFGCYEIIGVDAPFASAKMRSYLVYQPPHLHYPWHHHPAEELYVVIAGKAEFHLQGQPPRMLTSGQSAFHPASKSHALTSHDDPVLAYVIWRDDFDVGPVWSELKHLEKNMRASTEKS